MRLRIGVTVRLTIVSTLLSLIIGLSLGSLSALFKDSVFDRLISLLTYILLCVPGFLLASVALIFFAFTLGWFPAGGMYDPIKGGGLADRLYHLVLPWLLMGISGSPGLIRFSRTSVLEVTGEEFVRVSRGKGLKESAVRTRHILRNALLPIVTIVGRTIPRMIGGSALYESVFLFPGLGLWTAESAANKDFSIMIAAITVMALLIIVVNLIVDISYAWIDPRVRYS